MTTINAKPLIVQAVEALKRFDRDTAIALFQKDLITAPAGGDRWLSVAKLAATIGERGIELEAMRRYSESLPQTLDHLLAYAQALSKVNRSDEAIRILDGLPSDVQSHPAVLHFRGSVFTETGEFEKAENCFRRALVAAPAVAQIWHGLSVIKTFKADDQDFSLMEAVRPGFKRQPVMAHSLFLYALAKAWHDVGNFTKAAQIYSEGAALMRTERQYNHNGWRNYVSQIIND